jgi:hypothetical protein
MLLRHLIVLIINARNIPPCSRTVVGHLIGQIKLTRIHEIKFLSPGCGSNKEQDFLFTISKDPARQVLQPDEPNFCSSIKRRIQSVIRPHGGAICPSRSKPKPREEAQTKRSSGASMSEANGGARRDRTDDLMLAKHALSQLSYGPVWKGNLTDGSNGGPG